MEHNTTNGRAGQMRDVNAVLAAHERLVHWMVRQQWLGELSYAAAVQAYPLNTLGRYVAAQDWPSGSCRARSAIRLAKLGSA